MQAPSDDGSCVDREVHAHSSRDRGCNSPGLLTREWGDRRRRPGVEEAPWGGERNRFQHTTFPEDNPEIIEPRQTGRCRSDTYEYASAHSR